MTDLLARVGKLTASRMGDATAKIKSGWGASRAQYMAELVYERINEAPFPKSVNPTMQWGLDQEAAGLIIYEITRNLATYAPVGFCPHPSIVNSGASPDGLVEAEGLVEIKCPTPATHLATLEGAPIDGSYIKQVQWQMACTGRAWCDWVSYDPRIKYQSMQMKIVRVPRDDALIAELEKHAIAFLKELDARVLALRSAYDLRATLEAIA